VDRIECPRSWYEWDDYRPDPDAINALLRSPHLCRVKVFDLSGLWLTSSNVLALLAAPNLASVEEIEVGFGDPPDCDPEEAVHQLKSRFKRVIHR
jgi:hypothetical protein